MGIGGISIWQLLIVLAIVLLLFGTKRLKGLGGDLGGAIKGFKKAVQDEDKKAQEGEKTHLTSDKTEQSTDDESIKNTEKEKV